MESPSINSATRFSNSFGSSELLGTSLYGLAVDSDHSVFIAHTDARNDANGRAGTRKDGLAQLDNRPWLNRIAQVDCSGECSTPRCLDLEPLPPLHPQPSMALATPFGIALSDDESTLAVTAAGSNKLFTVDANTGAVSQRVGVGAAPRGLALMADDRGTPKEAWVLNAISNTVPVVDLGAQATAAGATIALEDPTPADIKRGRRTFNSAEASSSGTFTPGVGQFDKHWNTVELATNAISEVGGEVRIDLKSAAIFPWHAQISHSAMVVAGQQHTLCYAARADGPRFITA